LMIATSRVRVKVFFRDCVSPMVALPRSIFFESQVFVYILFMQTVSGALLAVSCQMCSHCSRTNPIDRVHARVAFALFVFDVELIVDTDRIVIDV
jgi:hypothetical protein